MSVGEFVTETKDDFNSPTTSTFVNKMPQCRQTVATLEEVSFYVVKQFHLTFNTCLF